MKLPFVSSRESPVGENQNQRLCSRNIQISVPCELVMDLLSQGAILQLQMGPLPLRPHLTRPEGPGVNIPRPEGPGANIPRPNPNETGNIRPNPSGGSEADPPRPERPPSRHPAARNVRTVRPIRPVRTVSPFTDWSSLSENNDVISISSSDEEDNYVPRSPEYIPNSPGPETESEDQNPRQNGDESRRPGQVNTNDNENRPRSPLGRGNFLQRVSPFLRGLGHPRRQLGRIRPM